MNRSLEDLLTDYYRLRNVVGETMERMRERMSNLEDLLRKSKRHHRYCEDGWYSCPKSTEGCIDEAEGTDCNCGADEWNKKVDECLGS